MPTIVQWINLLEAKIEDQKRYARPWELRYQNDYVLPFIAAEYREVYGARVDNLLLTALEAPRAGTAAIGVDALVERLTLLGGTSDDTATRAALTAAWEDNDLDVMHREAHRDALVRRESFGVVNTTADGRSVVTIESSEQAAIHRTQGPPYDVDAYLKIWFDEWTTKGRGELRLPGKIYQLEQDDVPSDDPQGSGASTRWRVASETDRPQLVEVVQFAHRARLLQPARSEIEPIYTLVDIADLIDGLMVFAGHFGAVPIRWGTGLDIPRDPTDPTKPLLGPDGKPVIGFRPRADQFWFNGNPNARFGQMLPASLDTYVVWANWVRGELRAATKVASTYYALELKSHMSAELLKTDEAPMVRRVNAIGRQGTFNQAWRRLLSMMMRAEGYRGRVTAVWEDPQTRIEAAAVDAFQKAVASGIGVETAAQQFLGWTPELAAQGAIEADLRRSQLAVAGPPVELEQPTLL